MASNEKVTAYDCYVKRRTWRDTALGAGVLLIQNRLNEEPLHLGHRTHQSVDVLKVIVESE